MNQPDWLKSILSGFAKIEEKLDKQSPTDELTNKIKSLESELVGAKGVIAERDETIVSLKSDLEKAQNEVKDANSKIQTANEKAEAAEKKAQEILATQGLSVEQLPEGGDPGAKSTADQISDLRKKLAASTDSKEKYTLSSQIRELLSKKN